VDGRFADGGRTTEISGQAASLDGKLFVKLFVLVELYPYF
jgi:hypothetical protein